MRRIERILMLVPAISCLAMFPAAAFTLRIGPWQMSTVVMNMAPARVAPEGIVTVTGFGLGQSMVRNVYLMDAKGNHRVQILEQVNTMLRFRVPSDMSLGPKRLAIERAGLAYEFMGSPKLVELDFHLDVVNDAPTPADPPMPYPTFPTGF